MARLAVLVGVLAVAAAFGVGSPASASAACVHVEGLRVCTRPVVGGRQLCVKGNYHGRHVDYCTVRRAHGRG
jgi:hypothetical protein